MIGLSLFTVAVVASAVAAPDAEASMHRSPHTEHSTWLLGVKGVQLTAFPAEGETAAGGGVGLFAEATVIEGWLEIELSASVVRIGSEDEWVVPVDLLLKKPFHIGDVTPYVAIGPTVSFVRGEENIVGVGAAAVVGAYVWLSDSWGIDIEVDYALLEEDGAQHELTFAAGPTLRF